MATHYPHAYADGNQQGLHYSGFLPSRRERRIGNQSLTRRGAREIVKIRGESAKLG